MMVNHHPQQQRSSIMMVCCLCGDVGFPNKLFSCKRCCSRYQHSYCSNYKGESWEEICDWCVQMSHEGLQGGGRGPGGCSSRRLPAAVASRSEYSGERIKRDEVVVSPKSGGSGGRSHGGGVPSPRQSTRRYKLLKDVMC